MSVEVAYPVIADTKYVRVKEMFKTFRYGYDRNRGHTGVPYTSHYDQYYPFDGKLMETIMEHNEQEEVQVGV